MGRRMNQRLNKLQTPLVITGVCKLLGECKSLVHWSVVFPSWSTLLSVAPGGHRWSCSFLVPASGLWSTERLNHSERSGGLFCGSTKSWPELNIAAQFEPPSQHKRTALNLSHLQSFNKGRQSLSSTEIQAISGVCVPRGGFFIQGPFDGAVLASGINVYKTGERR